MKINLLILMVSALSFSSASFGQTSYSDQMVSENTKIGQMFKVTLTPGKKMIEVHVVGNEVANFKFSELDMGATFSVGGQEWSVRPKKQKNSFFIENPKELPSDASPKLKIQIRHNKNKENFDFNLHRKD